MSPKLSYKPLHPIVKDLPKELQGLADSAIDHIGTMLNNMDIQGVLEVAIYSGLAKLGYDKLPAGIPTELKLLWGPIGLKLATSTTSGGGDVGFEIMGTGFKVPCNSQVAGLTMLSTLGFACLPWGNLIDKTAANIAIVNKMREDNIKVAEPFIEGQMTPEEKAELLRLQTRAAMSIFGGGDAAFNDLQAYLKMLIEKYPDKEQELEPRIRGWGEGGAR